jgi:predicted DNA-binding transcriptional regulator YafY
MMTLLLQLQVRGQASARELARQLEVSERTVQRDVEALVAAGIPVRSTRGPAGGYRLDRGYRTRLTGVGLDEAGALAFLGLAGPAEQLGLGEMLEGGRIKVWASLTGEARERAGRSVARFHLDPVRWYGTPEPVPCLTQLADAVWRDRRVRLGYVRDGRATAREVDPLGLVLAAGDWYLVALRDGGRRTYRASRVRSVELLDDPTVPFENESWACSAVLSLGAAVEVLRPEAMRARVAEEIRSAAARYAPPVPPPRARPVE